MADNEIKVALTLAEFVGKLISETFKAVISSMVDQVRQQEAIIAGTELELAEFAPQFISDNDVEEHLSALFPCWDDSHAHAIFEGAPYQPARDDLVEKPAIMELTGYMMEKDDYGKNKLTKKDVEEIKLTITKKGVKGIKSAVRMNLAEDRQKSLIALMRQGVPRVIVESGRILSKVTFIVNQQESTGNGNTDSNESDTAGSEEAALNVKPSSIPAGMLKSKLKRLSPMIFKPEILDITRMLVKQADDQAPQTSEAKVYGEVEIKFKTIT